MYQVLLSREAEKGASKIDKRYRKAVNESVLLLSQNPLVGKSLVGELKGQYSFRVGVYRLIYIFNSKSNKLYIISIDHRKDVYR